MHTYVLTSFIVNVACLAVLVLCAQVQQRVTPTMVLSFFWGGFCILWAGTLLFIG